MSTRATYRIKEYGGESESLQYFYIHHDGYPEGAASYFEEMLLNFEKLIGAPLDVNVRIRPGKLICAFGMINGAQFTEDHEIHGDTEYCYNISFDVKTNAFYVIAYSLDFNEGSKQFFRGTVEEFIKKHKE